MPVKHQGVDDEVYNSNDNGCVRRDCKDSNSKQDEYLLYSGEWERIGIVSANNWAK